MAVDHEPLEAGQLLRPRIIDRKDTKSERRKASVGGQYRMR